MMNRRWSRIFFSTNKASKPIPAKIQIKTAELITGIIVDFRIFKPAGRGTTETYSRAYVNVQNQNFSNTPTRQRIKQVIPKGNITPTTNRTAFNKKGLSSNVLRRSCEKR